MDKVSVRRLGGRINNVSVNKFYDIMDRLKAGHRNVSHGNVQLRTSHRSLKATMAIGWMKKKCDAIGDSMPDRDEVSIMDIISLIV